MVGRRSICSAERATASLQRPSGSLGGVIDLLAGPTEILIIADQAADPSLLACDLLGQAEHDPNSGICLITTSEDVARKTIVEVERQLADLPTRDVAALSWRDNGIVYLADSREEALSLCDDYAPEHLELHTEDNSYFVDRLTNYGSLLSAGNHSRLRRQDDRHESICRPAVPRATRAGYG